MNPDETIGFSGALDVCAWLSHVAYQAQRHVLVDGRSWHTIVQLSNFFKSFLGANVPLTGCMSFLDDLEKIFHKSNSTPTRENGCIIGILQGVSW